MSSKMPENSVQLNRSVSRDTLIYNGVTLRLVPHFPDNGYRFYVSNDGTVGLRISPDGKEILQNAIPTTWQNSSIPSNANRKQRYLMYKQAWGWNLGILVSHAVYMAWSAQRIPLYHQIHHLNGITTDNSIDNLLCVEYREHRTVSDARQTALRKLVPDGDLRAFPYDRLRYFQDPRTLSDEDFQSELDALRAELKKRPLVKVNPHDAAEQEPLKYC